MKPEVTRRGPQWGVPLHMMAKVVGSQCNMRCDYCYYLEKGHTLQTTAADTSALRTVMDDTILERYVLDYIMSQPLGIPVVFTWHGGEALLRPRAFYERALALQRQYGTGRTIENCIQTNGLLMSEDWARFFRDRGFLVGISLDGPQEQHDRYRRTVGGGGSFVRVMRAIELMQRVGTEFNVLSTINRFNADAPQAYYDFLRAHELHYIQFTPIVERVRREQARYTHVEAPRPVAEPHLRPNYSGQGIRMAPYSVLPEQWGDFLCALFDAWVVRDVGTTFIQLFDSTLAGWMGVAPGVCTLAPRCGHAGVVEHDGSVYSCDHYVYPDYCLGNVATEGLARLMTSPRQVAFGMLKETALTAQCRACTYRFACHGECPKNRFALSRDGEAGHNYLCSGYYRFFEHAAPYMDYMKQCLMQQRSPGLVMQAIALGQLPRPTSIENFE